MVSSNLVIGRQLLSVLFAIIWNTIHDIYVYIYTVSSRSLQYLEAYHYLSKNNRGSQLCLCHSLLVKSLSNSNAKTNLSCMDLHPIICSILLGFCCFFGERRFWTQRPLSDAAVPGILSNRIQNFWHVKLRYFAMGGERHKQSIHDPYPWPWHLECLQNLMKRDGGSCPYLCFVWSDPAAKKYLCLHHEMCNFVWIPFPATSVTQDEA